MHDDRKSTGKTRRTLLKAALGAAVAPLVLRAGRAHAGSPVSQIKTVVPGTITVATNGAMPTVDATGPGMKGIDGEIISRIAARLKLTVTPALMDWGATVEAVRSGRADMVVGNMNWTEKRAKVLAVSDTIYYYTQFLAQRKGAIIKSKTMSIADLKGHSIGTIIGAPPQGEIKSMPFVTEAKLYDTTDACVRDVLAGRLDFGALDAMEAAYLFRKNPDWDIELIELQPSPDYPMLSAKVPSAIGINPNELVLQDAVNAGIAWLWKSGQIKDILASYGLTGDGFLAAPAVDPRIGVDRDQDHRIIGASAHDVTDFASVFS